jgi:uncharacterized protein (DUF58 family)
VTMGKVQSRLRFGLTDAGMMLLRGVVYVGLAALVVPAFGVLAVLVSVMLVALVVGFVARPRISLSGSFPERIIAGQTAELVYRLRNIGRLAAYNLSLQFSGLPASFEQVGDVRLLPRLGPGETAEVALTIRPKRRGCYQIAPPSCRSSFPFNLFHFGTGPSVGETLLVLPAFWRLQVPLAGRRRHVAASGVRPAGHAGASPEYVGNRPFMAGDSPRRIDVRAWARLARPATKEYDNDLDNYAALILDTRLPQTRGKAPARESRELEAAVSLCASVAYTIHKDCLIDLLLAGPDLHSFATLPRAMRLDHIHETLAAVAPPDAYRVEQIAPLLEERLPEISEAVFILSCWDGLYQSLVEQADRAGCHCTVILVGEPDRDVKESRQRTEDGAEKAALSSVFCPASCDFRFVPADEVLAGRVEHL